MPLSGKQFYECPALGTNDPSLGPATSYRPLLADTVDAAGGVWAVSEQDSDTSPTSFIVVVNDRVDPSLPRNPAVHANIASQVSTATSLGPNLAAAQASVRARLQNGAIRASRMHDQTVAGE